METTTQKTYDIVGLDDAFVDEFYHTTADHLHSHGLTIGNTHAPFDSKALQTLIGKLPCHLQMSGGAAANTITRMQKHRAKTAFTGLIGTGDRADQFTKDLKKTGVDVYPIYTENTEATGRCAVFLTNENGVKDRTMATSLPQNIKLDKTKLNENLLKDTRMLLVQAYLWTPDSKDALLHAMQTTKNAGGKVASRLSASFRVTEKRTELMDMLEKKNVDILFGNRDEFDALFPHETEQGLQDRLISFSRNKCGTIVRTMGKEGAQIFDHGKKYTIKAVDTNVVDTSGAGDAYAAGILKGILDGKSIEEAGTQAAKWSAEVISHYGARQPDAPPSLTQNRQYAGALQHMKGPIEQFVRP